MQYFIRSCPALKLTTQVFEANSIFSYMSNPNVTFKETNINFSTLAVLTLVVLSIHMTYFKTNVSVIYNEIILSSILPVADPRVDVYLRC